MASHRYWRLVCGTFFYDNIVHHVLFVEIEMAATAGGADQATSGGASAQQTDAGTGPGAAFDNDFSDVDGWGAYDLSSPTTFWIQQDFGAATTVAEIRLFSDSAGDIQSPVIEVQVSDDGTSWTSLQTFDPVSWSGAEATLTLASGPDEVAGAPITAGAAVLSGGAVGQSHEIGGGSIAAGSAALSGGAVGQGHALAGGAITAGTAALSGGALEQSHALAGGAITAGAAILSGGTLAQPHGIGGGEVASGSPSVSGGAVGQIHAVAGGAATSSDPTITEGAVGQSHAISGGAITAGEPAISGGAVAVDGADQIEGDTITAGVPALSGGALAQVHEVGGDTIEAGSPALSGGALGQSHEVAGGTITAGAASLSGGAFGEATSVGGGAIIGGAPALSGGGVGQAHWFGGGSIAAGIAVIAGGLISPPLGVAGAVLAGEPAFIDGGSIGQSHAVRGTLIDAGAPTITGGHIGNPTAPVFVVTDWIGGTAAVYRARQEGRDTYSAIQASWPQPEANFEMQTLEPAVVPGRTWTGGDADLDAMDLSFVPFPAQAMHLQLIRARRQALQREHTLTLGPDFYASGGQAGDWVEFALPAGYEGRNGLFEIVQVGEFDLSLMTQTVTAREIAEDIYDFDPATDEQEVYEATFVEADPVLEAVTDLTLTATTQGIASAITVEFVASDTLVARRSAFEVMLLDALGEVKQQQTLRIFGDVMGAQTLETTFGNLDADTAYEVAVTAVSFGLRSNPVFATATTGTGPTIVDGGDY